MLFQLWAIKVVKAFHSSLHESIQKPKSHASIDNFMTPPEFSIYEEVPRTPLLEEVEDHLETEMVSQSGINMHQPDGTFTPHDNKNNNAVAASQVQIVASHSDNPLHSLETSV